MEAERGAKTSIYQKNRLKLPRISTSRLTTRLTRATNSKTRLLRFNLSKPIDKALL